MPKASQVAHDLRVLADALDKSPDAEIAQPMVSFYHWNDSDKEKFLNLVPSLPRPLVKKYDGGDLKLERDTTGLWIRVTIRRDSLCRLVKPAQAAVYECDPILSAIEQEALDAEVSDVE